MKKTKFYMTNYRSNIFSKEMTLELKDLGNNNFETSNGTTIHIFETLHYMRNIKQNEDWFLKNLYHFNK